MFLPCREAQILKVSVETSESYGFLRCFRENIVQADFQSTILIIWFLRGFGIICTFIRESNLFSP